jgi:hypothetical protein
MRLHFQLFHLTDRKWSTNDDQILNGNKISGDILFILIMKKIQIQDKAFTK